MEFTAGYDVEATVMELLGSSKAYSQLSMKGNRHAGVV